MIHENTMNHVKKNHEKQYVWKQIQNTVTGKLEGWRREERVQPKIAKDTSSSGKPMILSKVLVFKNMDRPLFVSPDTLPSKNIKEKSFMTLSLLSRSRTSSSVTTYHINERPLDVSTQNLRARKNDINLSKDIIFNHNSRPSDSQMNLDSSRTNWI